MSTSKIHKENRECNLFFGGDICISNKIEENFITKELQSFIVSHNLSIANWEAPIIEPSFKESLKAGPSIHQHHTYTHFLNKKLFDVYSLANNHLFDYGKEGAQNTINTLEKHTYLLGASTASNHKIYEPLILEHSNLKIAFIACAEHQFGTAKEENQNMGYAWIFSNQIIQNIQRIKEKVDFIIILTHAGLEMEKLPLPEWRECYKNLIDNGADLIIASHPHVIQPKEIYKDKTIYYSLGNFLFNSQNESKEWNTSLGLSCCLKLENDTKTIQCQEHFIEWNSKNKILQFSENSSKQKKYFDNLNSILQNSEEYNAKIIEICTKVWREYYQGYFVFQKDIVKYTLINHKLIRFFLNLIGIKNKKQEIFSPSSRVMLYHNISIETHRFAIERAIKEIDKLH